MDPDITDFGYNRRNLAMYSCEFLEMLRHAEGSVITELFKIKKGHYTKGGMQ
jgi:hypothetical protein